jgi:hypothetical protein
MLDLGILTRYRLALRNCVVFGSPARNGLQGNGSICEGTCKDQGILTRNWFQGVGSGCWHFRSFRFYRKNNISEINCINYVFPFLHSRLNL